jgi:hypothetical protein
MKIHWAMIGLVGTLAGGLTGCATPVANYSVEVKQFSRPPVHSTSTVSVGDEMLAQGSTADQDGLQLQTTVHVSWAYTLSPGFYAKTGSDTENAYYSFMFQSSSVPGLGVLTKNPLSDPPQSVKTNLDGSKVCVVTVFNLYVCDAGARGELTKRSISSDNAFQQTLIYNGRVGDKINIGYREFYGSTARPAFNNNVEYDLATSDTIAYRGATLKIIKADNSSITYEVLSNFNVSK